MPPEPVTPVREGCLELSWLLIPVHQLNLNPLLVRLAVGGVGVDVDTSQSLSLVLVSSLGSAANPDINNVSDIKNSNSSSIISQS